MKPTTDSHYIRHLIAQGEHQTQDFKFEISDAGKIAKSLSAFSNTAGGRLLVGVKDNGKIAGVKSDEEIYMIEAAAKMYCVPEVQCVMRTFSVEGRTVLLAEVEASDQKPVYAKDHSGKLLAYVRINDENILATTVHLKVWKQSRRAEGALLTYTHPEQLLLNLLQEEGEVTLNRCCRRSRLPRNRVENVLAQFIRYGIVEPTFRNHRFHYRLKE